MIIKRDFPYSLKNGANRPLHIWLPESYYQSTERYPVMYFFDGHNLYDDKDATYGKSWGMEEFLNRWGKQMILVGIECGHEGQERLTCIHSATTQQKINENRGERPGFCCSKLQFST